MASRSAEPVVDVVPLLERQKVGRFWLILFAVSWVVTFLDGFDLQIISFAGRYIQRSFALSNTELGTLGTIGVLGTLAGSILMGYLGDLTGRKPAIVVSAAGFGVFTLAFAVAQDYPQLIALRFATGVFLGGALPLIWALVTEFAPLRLRSTSVVITMIGYSFGSAAGGPLSNLLIPSFGWQSVFVAGGLASLLAVIPVVLFLPESVKFLAQRDLRQHRIAPILRRALPETAFADGTRFTVGTGPRQRTSFTPAALFRGRTLAVVTPLIWLAYLSSSAIVFYLAFWGPILNERIGFSVSQAATLAAWASVAGAAGQLVAGRFIDRRGAGMIALLPTLAVPCLLAIGLLPLSAAPYIVILLVSHALIIGGHGGVISVTGIFYPPAIRANGAGWATSVAKLGAMLGPWLAGFALDHGVGVRGTFFVFAVFPIVMVVALVALGRVQRGLPAGADGSMLTPVSTKEDRTAV
ncbi:MFS transporter [Amycolatopsis sp. K13G38]|uniref:MFS transporter n=1 Tax=Amycolatopsis acididurans TaxID=2724524 RepID=A0ABX1IV97_9PSEU|nr:MFS transporter [Amycolatopsis acididurans]NKQ51422.1 MFS transporter [Amycolatopsis acididurans]